MNPHFGDELITLKDAEKLGYSPEWLAQQVREGKLPDSEWISREELERLVRESLRPHC